LTRARARRQVRHDHLPEHHRRQVRLFGTCRAGSLLLANKRMSPIRRQFNLPYVSEATLTGLLAHVLYGVYDINGPPNLWWTWHDGDPSISKRACWCWCSCARAAACLPAN
jgi:hypothetical protein